MTRKTFEITDLVEEIGELDIRFLGEPKHEHVPLVSERISLISTGFLPRKDKCKCDLNYRICKMLYKRYCKPCVSAAGSSITFRKTRKVMVIPQCRIQTLRWKEGGGGSSGPKIRAREKRQKIRWWAQASRAPPLYRPLIPPVLI